MSIPCVFPFWDGGSTGAAPSAFDEFRPVPLVSNTVSSWTFGRTTSRMDAVAFKDILYISRSRKSGQTWFVEGCYLDCVVLLKWLSLIA